MVCPTSDTVQEVAGTHAYTYLLVPRENWVAGRELWRLLTVTQFKMSETPGPRGTLQQNCTDSKSMLCKTKKKAGPRPQTRLHTQHVILHWVLGLSKLSGCCRDSQDLRTSSAGTVRRSDLSPVIGEEVPAPRSRVQNRTGAGVVSQLTFCWVGLETSNTKKWTT